MSLSPMSLMTGISVSGSVAHDRRHGQDACQQVDPAGNQAYGFEC